MIDETEKARILEHWQRQLAAALEELATTKGEWGAHCSALCGGDEKILPYAIPESRGNCHAG